MAKKKQYQIKSGPDIGNIVYRVVLYVWAVVVILPLFWMVYTSVKQRDEFIADRFALPKDIWLANYQTAITNSAAESSLLRYFGNTFVIVAISTVLMLVMVSVTAYVLGKYRFHGKKLFEGFYFAAMLVPSVLVLIPLWFQLRQLGTNLLGSPSAITDNIFTLAVVYAVQALPAYEAGEMYLQSLSSMLPALVLDPRGGESILDMAAAPGGKAHEPPAYHLLQKSVRTRPCLRYRKHSCGSQNCRTGQRLCCRG